MTEARYDYQGYFKSRERAEEKIDSYIAADIISPCEKPVAELRTDAHGKVLGYVITLLAA